MSEDPFITIDPLSLMQIFNETCSCKTAKKLNRLQETLLTSPSEESLFAHNFVKLQIRLPKKILVNGSIQQKRFSHTSVWTVEAAQHPQKGQRMNCSRVVSNKMKIQQAKEQNLKFR